MARYTGPRVRVSRRIGFNVFENKKGDKALQDRPYPPGENGRKRVRETDYGTQLKEKQKVRYMYGILEKQFRNYYKEASRMPGITGENLLILLESRLDNVIYRAGFASTRPQARQIASHRHLKLNGSLVDVPSIQIKPGDKIELKKSNWVLSFDDKTLVDPAPERWAVIKDGGDFDAFTGATVTPRAVVAAVKSAMEYSQNNRSALFEIEEANES